MGFFRQAFGIVKGVLRAIFIADDAARASPPETMPVGQAPRVLAPGYTILRRGPGGRRKRVRFEDDEPRRDIGWAPKKPRKTDEEVEASIAAIIARYDEEKRRAAQAAEWRMQQEAAARKKRVEESKAHRARVIEQETARVMAEEQKRKEILEKAEEAGKALFATLEWYREEDRQRRIAENVRAATGVDIAEAGRIIYHALPTELVDITGVPGFQSIPGLVDVLFDGTVFIDHHVYGMVEWNVNTRAGRLLPPGRQLQAADTIAAPQAASQQYAADSLPINELSSSQTAVTGGDVMLQTGAQSDIDLPSSLKEHAQQPALFRECFAGAAGITNADAGTVGAGSSAVPQPPAASAPFTSGAQTLQDVKSQSEEAASKLLWFKPKFNDCCNEIDMQLVMLKPGKFDSFWRSAEDLRLLLEPLVLWLEGPTGTPLSARSVKISDALINELGLNDRRSAALRTVSDACDANRYMKKKLPPKKKEDIFGPLSELLKRWEVVVGTYSQ